MTRYKLMLRDYGYYVQDCDENLIGMLCKVVDQDSHVIGWNFYHSACKEKRLTPTVIHKSRHAALAGSGALTRHHAKAALTAADLGYQRVRGTADPHMRAPHPESPARWRAQPQSVSASPESKPS